MRECGLSFEVSRPDIDENAIRRESASELVMALGLAKAEALLTGHSGPDFAKRGCLLITGDQVVVAMGGTILEKPESADEARSFIASYASGAAFRSNALRVAWTRSERSVLLGPDPPRTVGSCVVTDAVSGRQWSAVDEACVHFRPIPESTVSELITEGSVFSCAGGLMVEHPLVQPHVERMDGTMDSIMGLSKSTLKHLLTEALAARGAPVPPSLL
jgi:septum formation protein